MGTAVESDTACAVRRAEELLRKDSPLTSSDCDELHELFNEITGSQFLALTQNPQHSRALGEYDRHMRRPALRIAFLMTVIFVFSAITGIYLVSQQ